MSPATRHFVAGVRPCITMSAPRSKISNINFPSFRICSKISGFPNISNKSGCRSQYIQQISPLIPINPTLIESICDSRHVLVYVLLNYNIAFAGYFPHEPMLHLRFDHQKIPDIGTQYPGHFDQGLRIDPNIFFSLHATLKTGEESTLNRTTDSV